MRAAGIICEYNPFHNGHKYQLEKVKKEYDAVVCVMSGSFVQRGDVAVYDKWARAEAALKNGADLVIELPVRYSLSSAEGFARGACEILDSLGVVDAIFFGSECNNIKELTNAAEIIMKEPPAVSDKISVLLKTGMSYPAARCKAYSGIIDNELLNSPNDILAIEYIMALKKLNSTIKPYAMERKAVGHNEHNPTDGYASATHLRCLISEKKEIGLYTPYDFSCHETYNVNRLTDIFKFLLITKGTEAFCDIQGMEDGLDNRFVKSTDCESFDEMINYVKTKRYTHSRLKRIALSAIIGIKGGYTPPEYVRVLGMTDTGRQLLSVMRDKCRLPIVNKMADFKSNSIDEDIRASNIAALCSDKQGKYNRDYLTSPIYVKNR